ncbi:MAG: nitroreductase family protein [Actinomycetota bacterium]
MEFDLEQTDTLLATTRAVRRRLDLGREVPPELILECIDLAEQAPSGGAISSRRWMVVRDAAAKAALAELYRKAGGDWMIGTAERLAGTDHPNAAVMESAAHLATHLADVPAIVIPCIWGVHDGSGRPGLFDSVVQSAWSFCLAARARGLGTAWTTVHLGEADAVAELLGIPEGVTQIALLPVAYTLGTEFGRADRRPASEIAYLDRWGVTTLTPAGDRPMLVDGPTMTVERDVDATPAAVWAIVSDPSTPAAFSEELQGAAWVDGDEPGVGARIIGRNRHPAVGEWETTSYVMAWEPERRFGWNVSSADNPGAQWAFEIESMPGGVRLRMTVTLGPGGSGLTPAIEAMPDREQDIISRRLREHGENMARTLDGIAGLAESRTADGSSA